MSVLSCDRKGCKNIMCDRYSPTFGYICEECFAELKDISRFSVISINEFMSGYAYNKVPELDTTFLEDIFKNELL